MNSICGSNNVSNRFYSSTPSQPKQDMIDGYRYKFAALAEEIDSDVTIFGYKEECLKHLELAHMYLNKALTAVR